MQIRKRTIVIATLACLFAILAIAARGPYISDYLKKLILPELELMTGKRVIADKIQVNLFPLFIEMKDAKVSDEHGRTLLSVERTKGYVSLSGIFRKELILNRLVIRESVLKTNRSEIEEIAESVKKYLAIERKDALKVKIRAVVLDKPFFEVEDGEKKILAKGGYSEVLLTDRPDFHISLSEVNVHVPRMPELNGGIDAFFTLNKDSISVKTLKVNTYGSVIKSEGDISTKPISANLKTDVDLLVESVRKIFGLHNRGDGSIKVAGTVKAKSFSSLGDISVDVKVSGRLFLETLMELLKVKEKLTGLVKVEGIVRGTLTDLQGDAKADMEDGNLFGVKIDKLTCNIDYRDKVMKFNDAHGSLYGGTAVAEARINLPVVNYYSFKVFAKQVGSKGLFELINWDPGIAPGKVDGEISSEGSYFNPHGSFSYKKQPGGKDILERVNSIEGTFTMTDNIVTLPQITISTGISTVSGTGSVDLPKNKLAFRANGTTKDVIDLTAPYFNALSGPAVFSALLSGEISDPVLDLKFTSSDQKFYSGKMDIPNLMRSHTVAFNSVEGEVAYRKNLLVVKNFEAVSSGMKLKTSGQITFAQAKHLFDVISPVYNLRIAFDHGDLTDLSAIIQGSPPLTGNFSCGFTLVGPGERSRAEGELHASEVIVSGDYSLNMVDAELAFERGEFNFKSLAIKKGPVFLNAKGMVSLDKRYDMSATVKSLDLFNVMPAGLQDKFRDSNLKLISLSDVAINGRGTFAEPFLKLTGLLRYNDPAREQASGSGMITAELKGKNATLDGRFMNGKIKVNGSATLKDSMPWQVNLEMLSARSDFLIAGFLKDVPEDLLVNLKGNIRLWGDRNNVNGVLLLDKAYIYGYGYGMANSRPVSVKLKDKILTIESFSMKSETSELQLKGGMHIGNSFSLSLNGASSLTPLRSASKNIDVLKGDATFSLTLSGGWEKPRVNGKMKVQNGALGFKNLPYRVTGVSASIYADEDRIVLEDAKGKISGGDVSMRGNVYLDRFSLKRFIFESKLSNVTVSASRNFWVHFDGDLTYQGNSQLQDITGDIYISKARYTERIEWKSWLLQARKKERPKFESGKIDRTKLNVRVRGNNMSIDNNVARAAMKMDLVARGDIGQPVLYGRMETINGIVYFRNNEFTVLKGAIDFARPDEINPYFDILAETKIKNYTVRLALDGYIDQFNLSLSSSPTLEENDILSLLTVGDVGKNLKGLEGGIGAAEATSFLTGKLQDVAEDRLKTITGVDRLQIDPSVSRTTGTVAPRVTLSKKLIGDRLYATYSASADVKEGQIVKLEYLLNKNASLVGIRDAQGGIGADIKFRFEFK